jgi:hypothetical protein
MQYHETFEKHPPLRKERFSMVSMLAFRVRVKISLHFRRMDLGHLCSIQGCKTTGIASYFEDFGVEDRPKMA